jgi:sugar/nucleoside kinase (ribokinase family)
MQASSDIFLGWARAADIDGGERDFYVRQLRDWKVSLDIETIVPKGIAYYARACGWTLARAHARSGDRIALASYLGNGDSFDRALLEFSRAYADQNDADYTALSTAADAGRIKVQTGL